VTTTEERQHQMLTMAQHMPTQELRQQEGRIRAREAELNALEETAQADVKLAQKKVWPHPPNNFATS
jgi:hypothetical protein